MNRAILKLHLKKEDIKISLLRFNIASKGISFIFYDYKEDKTTKLLRDLCSSGLIAQASFGMIAPFTEEDEKIYNIKFDTWLKFDNIIVKPYNDEINKIYLKCIAIYEPNDAYKA